ncbi:Putative deoxyribonuclease YcfH [hydrothermal vent metagenome]|uniref:Putative deoxyribonuclease YcfH n=1 Tax=hydrothermal vent metagenome TaxID=652676 RepID=A0A1W1C0C6_9ZZZZ
MIIDTHCHLDDSRYRDDIEEVIDRAVSQGVEKFIIPGADPSTLHRAIELAEQYDNIYFAVGVHPYDAKNYNRNSLKPFVAHKKCIAIGECGLDYYRLPKSEDDIVEEKRLQREVFIDQIEWAKELDKPLIIHIRESTKDSLELLKLYAGDRGGVLHCYNAHEDLLKLADKNFYYGIGGVITFKNAKKLINVYPKIPIEKLLIETDAPYLTPHPKRGERNEPLYTRLVLEKMSTISEMPIDKLESIVRANSHRLFGI